MPFELPPASQPRLLRYAQQPWTGAARRSPKLRKWCDAQGYITPHFSWASYACQDGTVVPAGLRANAIRLHWLLEQMRHALGDQPMTVDGPYRTEARNHQVGGAADSRHIHADGADFFVAQVNHWIDTAGHLGTRNDVLAIAERVFAKGGVGNENSGTLHVDARGTLARFVTWTRS